MTENRASIVIPTFNRADFLKEAIDSALAQTIPCEVIVCDHGSTDNTPEVAASYGTKIKYFRREKDFGVHYCWLEGIINASHEWVHINYDDDWIAPEFMEKTLAMCTDKVGIVFSQATLFDNETRKTRILFTRFNFGSGTHPSSKLEKVLLSQVISPACTLVRKKDLLNGLLMGEVPLSTSHYKGVGPDLLFGLLPLLDYPYFAYTEEPLAYFRAHEGSITTDSEKSKERQKKIDMAYLETRRYYVLLKVVKNLGIKNLVYKLYRLLN